MWTRILGGVGALALTLALAWLYGNARYEAGQMRERSEWNALSAKQHQQRAEELVAAERRVTAATANYADRLAAIEPVVLRSRDTVTRYAQTPAGIALCLSAERVRGIDADASALGLQPDAAAASGDGTLHPNADPP